MKKALVMAGGGTRGIYQIGVIEALRELGEDDWNIITGTSVGALNAMFLVQHDFPAMIDMYEHLQADQIMNGFVPNPDDMRISTFIRERDSFVPSFRNWLKDHGVDIAPFRESLSMSTITRRNSLRPISISAVSRRLPRDMIPCM